MEFILLTLVVFFIWIFLFKDKASSLNNAQNNSNTQNHQNEDTEKRHLRNALSFAKQQHAIQKHHKVQQDKWNNSYAHAKTADLDKLSGVEFEHFLAGLFREHGYEVQLTSTSGDYGADLILSREKARIAVQAKRYVGSVGVQAVQEALSGMAYYKCNSAWVITTGTYTQNAIQLAQKSDVKLLRRIDIGKLMKSGKNS
jgi:restriction system protein